MVDFSKLPDLPSPADQPLESAGVWKRTWYEWLRTIDRLIRSILPVIDQLETDISNIGGFLESVNVQVFTSSDTYTPTPGMAYCIVEIVGGGGGGGGGDDNPDIGSGGGAGEYVRGRFTAAQIGANQTVTIGAAGSAGSGATNGGAGGTTSFGALMTAGGGGGGQDGGIATAAGAGGSGGSGGDLRISGQPGTSQVNQGEAAAMSGEGGSSMLGLGGPSVVASAGNVVNGNPGTGYGAGGGGGFTRSATDANGGAGTAGICIVTEYIAA